MSTDLERRYQRLLRCYPPSHRAAHREEMLGILLESARPGQRLPGASQTLNLVACGLAIRGRRFLTTGPWQDALAVLSLIAPVLMVVIAALNVAQSVREALDQAASAQVPVWQLLSLVPMLGGPALALVGWLAVLLLAVAGRRRAAAAIATVLLALDLTVLLADIIQRTGVSSVGLPLFLWMTAEGPAVLASLAACSLVFSAGSRRGLAVVGRRRACLMIAGLCVTYGFFPVVLLVSPSAHFSAPVFGLLGVLMIAIAIAVTRVSGTAGSRVAVLITAELLPGLAGAFSSASDPAAGLVFLISYGLLALLVWPLAIASWKRQPSRV
jgi:hypothetical protein